MGPTRGENSRVTSPAFTDFCFQGCKVNFVNLVKDQVDRLSGGDSRLSGDKSGLSYRENLQNSIRSNFPNGAGDGNDLASNLERLSRSQVKLEDGRCSSFGDMTKRLVAYKCTDTSKKLRKRTLFLRGALGVLEAQLSKMNLNIENLVSGGVCASRAMQFAQSQLKEQARVRGMIEELLLLSESLGSARKEAILVRELVDLQHAMTDLRVVGKSTLECMKARDKYQTHAGAVITPTPLASSTAYHDNLDLGSPTRDISVIGNSGCASNREQDTGYGTYSYPEKPRYNESSSLQRSGPHFSTTNLDLDIGSVIDTTSRSPEMFRKTFDDCEGPQIDCRNDPCAKKSIAVCCNELRIAACNKKLQNVVLDSAFIVIPVLVIIIYELFFNECETSVRRRKIFAGFAQTDIFADTPLGARLDTWY